jgi:hypothetical protein
MLAYMSLPMPNLFSDANEARETDEAHSVRGSHSQHPRLTSWNPELGGDTVRVVPLDVLTRIEVLTAKSRSSVCHACP